MRCNAAQDTRYKIKISIAMQPFKVEMIQHNYTTLQNIKQYELYYSHCHSGISKTHAHTLIIIILSILTIIGLI